MIRSICYFLIIYFVFLALLAYGQVDRFFYWIGVCSAATFAGGFVGTMFGELHLREQESEPYR